MKKYILVVAGVFLVLMWIKDKRIALWSTTSCLVLFIFLLLLRLSVGGIGLEAFMSMTILIIVSAYTVAYNGRKFLSRYVEVVVFLAAVSVILWIFCSVFPEMYKLIATRYTTDMTYKIYTDSTNYSLYNYDATGLFFYTMREVDNRNTGIFTEPGVFQMVLNSAMFVLLMMDKYLFEVSSLKKKIYISILSIAMFTTQSTTGYIGLGLIVLFYVFQTSGDKPLKKNTIIVTIIVAVLVLLMDYNLRGQESFWAVTVMKKLVNREEGLSLAASGSGRARIGAIVISLLSMLKHPFGIGYDRFEMLLNTNQTGFVAAEILSFGAVWGIIPLVFVLWWFFYPFIKSKETKSNIFLYVLLYFNTCLAQSSIFYPALIAIPIYLYNVKHGIKQREECVGSIAIND